MDGNPKAGIHPYRWLCKVLRDVGDVREDADAVLRNLLSIGILHHCHILLCPDSKDALLRKTDILDRDVLHIRQDQWSCYVVDLRADRVDAWPAHHAAR